MNDTERPGDMPTSLSPEFLPACSKRQDAGNQLKGFFGGLQIARLISIIIRCAAPLQHDRRERNVGEAFLPILPLSHFGYFLRTRRIMSPPFTYRVVTLLESSKPLALIRPSFHPRPLTRTHLVSGSRTGPEGVVRSVVPCAAHSSHHA